MPRNEIIEKIFNSLYTLGKHIKRSHMPKSGECPVIAKPQLRILFHLNNEKSLSATDIAEKMNITAGAVTQFVDSLIEEGYVERTPSNEDKRITTISFTKNGKEKFTEIRKHFLQKLGSLFDGLTDKELEQMYTLHQKVIINLSNKSYVK